MDDFKPIELPDKPVFDNFFYQDPPQTSELTFTNLFMWRLRYRPRWTVWAGCLIIVLSRGDDQIFGLPPVGMGDKARALDFLFDRLGEMTSEPTVSRVGRDFVEKHVDSQRFTATPDRANSDYVYLASDLINLPGNKFHRKKNHVNRFARTYQFEYRALDSDVVHSFIGMQETWCKLRNCAENEDLVAEDRAVYEALKNYAGLGFQGGAIFVDSKVEAFALGELLNPDTAVIHVEKANPECHGLYAAINQHFCANTWTGVTFINREQDLGLEGLRKAKLSYHPHHLVEKFVLTRKQ